MITTEPVTKVTDPKLLDSQGLIRLKNQLVGADPKKAAEIRAEIQQTILKSTSSFDD